MGICTQSYSDINVCSTARVCWPSGLYCELCSLTGLMVINQNILHNGNINTGAGIRDVNSQIILVTCRA